MPKADDLRAANADMLRGVRPDTPAPAAPEPKPASTTTRPGKRGARPVVAYVTPKERAILDAAAERAGLAISAWARATLLRVARGE